MSNQITVALPTDGKENQAQAVLAAAKALRVTNDAEYKEAAGFVQQVKRNREDIDKERDDWKRPLDTLAKKVQSLFKPTLDLYDQAEEVAKATMLAYSNRQDELRLEEQRRLDEAARKERERLASQAREAEAKARAEEERLRKEAEEAAAAGRAAEAARLAARADAAAEKGASKAEELQQRAASVVAPVISREPPKVAGIASRENWYAECVDLKALVKAVAEGRAPISLVMANSKVLGQQARSLKKEFVCDGVRVWSDKNLAAGAA